MSREIKFRAKCKQFNEWFYGDLVQELGGEKRTFILDCGVVKNKSEFDDFAVEVHPETICQYTGLKDKNGKEIYEGDILKCLTPANIGLHKEKFVVRYKTELFKCGFVACTLPKELGYIELWYDEIEVISSIHDKGGEA